MWPPPRRIFVFCSTPTGHSPFHLLAARSLARSLAHALHAHGIHLVYGGGTTGLMGELAKARSGPESVHGIIPRGYLGVERPGEDGGEARDESQEGGKRGLWGRLLPLPSKQGIGAKKPRANEAALLSHSIYGLTTIVPDGKKLMAREIAAGAPGSGFVGLSGGFGTMDGVMEMVVWGQMGVRGCGVCLMDVEGFWDPVVEWVEGAIERGFVRGGGEGEASG